MSRRRSPLGERITYSNGALPGKGWLRISAPPARSPSPNTLRRGSLSAGLTAYRIGLTWWFKRSQCLLEDAPRLDRNGVAGKRIAGAPPPCRVADEDAAFDERQNVTERRVLGALRELRVLRRRELAHQTIEQAVQHEALALVDRTPADTFPEARLREHAAESSLRAGDGPAQTAKEPFHPRRDGQVPLVRVLENVVV